MKKIVGFLSSKLFLASIALVFFCSTVFLVKHSNVINTKQTDHFNVVASSPNSIVHSRKNKNTFFTNPVLDCEVYDQGDETVIPRQAVVDLVDSLKSTYKIDLISIYFRDLNNGPWIGLGEKDVFSPASLLKMPYFIALLHYSEDNPDILYKKITITAEDFQNISEQNIKPGNPLALGKSYTLKEIAERMIVESDNTGLSILIKNIPHRYLDDIYETLGNIYSVSTSSDDEVLIRVKDVGSLFRILYNASYLTRENSEYALRIFSQSTYKSGLVAGVPKDTVVAHKFGERIDTVDQYGVSTRVEQIHDCGIVYYTAKPYILCVMTRGHDIGKQTKAISDISKFFFTKVSK